MPFSKIMASITLLSRDRLMATATLDALRREHGVARVATWTKLTWCAREQPTTCTIVGGATLPKRNPESALLEFARLYPSVPLVLVARHGMAPHALFHLGRAGLSNLVLLSLDGLAVELPRTVRAALADRSTDALVTRVVSPSLSRRELTAVRLAMEAVQHGWAADELADRVGLTRAHLSVLLRARGLPSAGHLLTWARMLHAGRWLMDPGRTAESVSRQLSYSSGSAFRRALRNYVGCTPTRLIEDGGFIRVLERFVEACDLSLPPRAFRSVA